MQPRKKSRLVVACLTAITFLGPMLSVTRPVMASDNDLKNDARLEGYKNRNVVLDTGTAPYYMLLAALGVIAISVMFKDAKRSHLD